MEKQDNKASKDAPSVPAIYPAIAQVQAAIDKQGIAKADQAKSDGISFRFRGIDAVLQSFSQFLAEAKVLMVPSYGDIAVDVRKTKAGNSTYNARVLGSFRLISLIDGSEVRLGDFYGEANDTQDKAIAKAQSISLRQAWIQSFTVPFSGLEDPEDGDSSGYEADEVPEQKPQRPVAKSEARSQPVDGSELTDNQKRLITAKLRAKNLDEATLAKEFGPVVAGTLNNALDWIKGHGK